MPKTPGKVHIKNSRSKRQIQADGNLAIDVKNQEKFEAKLDELPADPSESGVVYVGHIPHGFYEEEMRKFFSQFGAVKRLRLSRSKKTAASKGYAFVEFEYEDVAKIAAETMDNYLMFGRLLKCKFVPKEQLHPRIWQGANRKFKKIDWAQKQRVRKNKPRDTKSRTKVIKKLIRKENKTRNRLESLGIDYKFPGYTAQCTSTAKHKKFSDN